MTYELDIRESLLDAIEGYFGYIQKLYLLTTEDLVKIAETLNLDY